LCREARLATVEDLIATGTAALRDGTEGASIPHLREATARHPDDARLWQVLGLLYRNLEDLRPAVDALARAARLDPGSGRIAHAHARATMESGAPALALFDRARALTPNDGDLLLSWSAAMLAEGRLSAAIESFDQLLSASPAWIAGHTTLAQLRWLAGDADQATRSFDRALQASPRSAELWLGKIDVLIRAERFAEAAAAVASARQALGDQPALLLNAAICASELGDAATADSLFRRFAPFGDIPVASRYLRQLLRTGRAEEAATLAETLTGHPDADHIWPYLSVAWRLLDDPRWQWLEGDPRLIGSYDISEALAPIDELAGTLRRLHTARMEPLDQSVRGGTQTDGPLFARVDPVIQHVRAAIVDAVRRHLDSLPDDPTHPHLKYKHAPIRFAGSWSVRLTAGGHHSNHVHPRGFVSSALYVVVPPEADSGPPPAGHLALGQPPAELGLDLAPIRTIAPQPGHLVLFPSTMWHGTLPFGGGERLTIAFDVAKPR